MSESGNERQGIRSQTDLDIIATENTSVLQKVVVERSYYIEDH
jgi:hypothetical protein